MSDGTKNKKSRVTLERIMQMVYDLEHGLKVTPIYFYGTLLGLYRDKHLIEGDDDVDILLSTEDFEHVVKAFSDNDNVLNIPRVRLEWPGGSEERDIVQLFDADGNGPLDIYRYEDAGEDIHIPWDGGLLFKKSDIFPLKDVCMPRDPELILGDLYGPDWNVPKSKPYDWFDIQEVRFKRPIIPVSVCVPTYRADGKGGEFLDRLLRSIQRQSHYPMEIIVSDHSKDNDIRDVCICWKHRLNVLWFRNEDGLGSSSANLNNAIGLAQGQYIKILFGDDAYAPIHNGSLYCEYMTLHMSGCMWGVSGSMDVESLTPFSRMTHPVRVRRITRPFYNPEALRRGVNEISSPSVIMLRADTRHHTAAITFNEDLVWMMDVEWYYRMGQKYGPPSVCLNACIWNYIHDGQLTKTISEARKREELMVLQKLCVSPKDRQ